MVHLFPSMVQPNTLATKHPLYSIPVKSVVPPNNLDVSALNLYVLTFAAVYL